MSNAASACVIDTRRALSCRDVTAATHLKLISIIVIFVTSVVGISSPVLLARTFHGRPSYDKAILLIKCFAAGVILSTSFVHVLPDAFDALSDCRVRSRHPWRDFPFSGLVTLLGALLALLVDVTATAHVDGHGHGHGHGHGVKVREYERLTPVVGEDVLENGGVKEELNVHGHGRGGAKEEFDAKGNGDFGCHGVRDYEEGVEKVGVKEEFDIDGHGHGGGGDAVDVVKLKQRMVSQVLEIGIIFHSVIIGVTMGMSQNKCTIRPLVAALAFHQIFEGMGLGGCIAQAGFSIGTVAYMCFLFAVTTPVGIVLGMIVFSMTGYDDSNPNALIMEGLLGSLSSGVLIYMGLVDLIAVDFFHNKFMSSAPWLKKASYIALTLGSTAMSILALWA